jgi:hypothetical protein
MTKMLDTLNPIVAVKSHFIKKRRNTADKLLKELRDMEQELITIKSMVYSNVGSVAYDEVIDRCVKNFVQKWTKHVEMNKKISKFPSETKSTTLLFKFGTHLLDYLGKGMVYVEGHFSEINKESDELLRRFYSLYEHKLPYVVDFDFRHNLDSIWSSINPKLSFGVPHIRFDHIEGRTASHLSGKMLKVVDILRCHETDVIVSYQGRQFILNQRNCFGGKLHWHNVEVEEIETVVEGY